MDHTRTKSGKRPDLPFHLRSATEADFCRYLKHVEQVDFEYEVLDLFFEKIKRGTRTYKIDFSISAWDIHVEVKGYLDAKSLTKLKRTRIYYPEVFEKLWLVKQGLSERDKAKLAKIGFPLERVIDTAVLYAHRERMPQWESRKPSKKATKAAETAGSPFFSEIIRNSATQSPSPCVIETTPSTKERNEWQRNEQHENPQSRPQSKKKSSTTNSKKSTKKKSKSLKGAKTMTPKKIPQRPRKTGNLTTQSGKTTAAKKAMRKRKAKTPSQRKAN